MAQTQARTTAQTQTPPPLVCIIEDDEGIREALRTLLEDEGYRICVAADGLTGYALLRVAAEPVVALIDQKLPYRNGCALLELLAKDAQVQCRHAYIVMTASPHSTRQDYGESSAALNTPIVAKPFAIDDFLAAVATAATRLPGA